MADPKNTTQAPQLLDSTIWARIRQLDQTTEKVIKEEKKDSKHLQKAEDVMKRS